MTKIRNLFLYTALTLILILLSMASLHAQEERTPITLGESITVNVPPATGEGETLVAPAAIFTFTLEEPAYVTVIASATNDDGTDPFIGLYEDVRELLRINDAGFSPYATRQTDAIIDDQLLLAGTYNITVQRINAVGSGDITLSLVEGTPPFLGIGQITTVQGALNPNERYFLDVELQAGELVSIAVVSDDPEVLDPRLVVRGPNGEVVDRNDDHETLEVFLGDFDPKIEQLSVPETGTYEVMVRGFSPENSGSFRVIVTRYGQLDTTNAGVEVITAESRANARNTYTLEGQAGEIISITARAINDSSMDPEIRLLDPENIFIAINDDHGTDANDLGQFDARVSRVVLESDGTYTLDVNSVSGFGAYEVVIERFGVLSFVEFDPLVVSDGRAEALPTPQPTIEPEVTEEP